MFRHHKVRVHSTDVDSGDNIVLFSVLAQDFMDNSDGDASTATEDNISEPDSSSAQGERWNTVQGPVTIHGYSVRIFMNTLGAVFQGLSRYDDTTTESQKDGVIGHIFRRSFTSSDTTETELDEESAIKNLKYIRGWSAGRLSAPADPVDTVSQTLGSAHLQKKFTRKSFSHVGGGNYKKREKRGFVLVPNSETEFFSIGVKPIQTGFDNRTMYADLSVWMSFDNK